VTLSCEPARQRDRVTALHSHMFDEQPGFSSMHFWSIDDAEKLAKGLRGPLQVDRARGPKWIPMVCLSFGRCGRPILGPSPAAAPALPPTCEHALVLEKTICLHGVSGRTSHGYRTWLGMPAWRSPMWHDTVYVIDLEAAAPARITDLGEPQGVVLHRRRAMLLSLRNGD